MVAPKTHTRPKKEIGVTKPHLLPDLSRQIPPSSSPFNGEEEGLGVVERLYCETIGMVQGVVEIGLHFCFA
jgi:hypothetical protein